MFATRSTADRKQGGFTLVELLVVIGILAALAAVVIPNVSRFAGSGEAAANETEAVTVQAAMDLFMAENAVTLVALNITATGDFVASSPQLSPAYLRTSPTSCTYTWTIEGLVTQTVGCTETRLSNPSTDKRRRAMFRPAALCVRIITASLRVGVCTHTRGEETQITGTSPADKVR